MKQFDKQISSEVQLPSRSQLESWTVYDVTNWLHKVGNLFIHYYKPLESIHNCFLVKICVLYTIEIAETKYFWYV